MPRLFVSLLVVGSLCGLSTAFAYGAKPDNPSGFGELISGSVPMGTTASDSARNDDGPGASNEVQKGRDVDTNSTPNLPPNTP